MRPPTGPMWRRRPVSGVGARLALFALFLAAFLALKGCLTANWLAGERLGHGVPDPGAGPAGGANGPSGNTG